MGTIVPFGFKNGDSLSTDDSRGFKGRDISTFVVCHQLPKFGERKDNNLKDMGLSLTYTVNSRHGYNCTLAFFFKKQDRKTYY